MLGLHGALSATAGRHATMRGRWTQGNGTAALLAALLIPRRRRSPHGPGSLPMGASPGAVEGSHVAE